MTIYIYKLQNTINNKIYIGQTDNMSKRRREHKAKDRLYTKRTPLYRSIAKHGFDKFEMTMIESVENQEQADEREIYWIKHYNSRDLSVGYNIAEGGRVNRGFKVSEETRKLQSQKKKEYYKHNVSKSLGMKRTPEQVEKMQEISLKGENAVSAKLTNIQVKEIREKYLSLKYTLSDLAREYKLNITNIIGVAKNKTYKDPDYIIPSDFEEKFIIFSNKACGSHSCLKVKDHTGKIYDSIKEASRSLNITEAKARYILYRSKKYNPNLWLEFI
jgi:hypothetical protein